MSGSIGQDKQKALVATEAVSLVQPGMMLGLGTGSTIARFIDALLADKARSAGLTVTPTSRASAALAERGGLNVVYPCAGLFPDLLIDGADEAAPDLSMIKGGGGALLWEKILASASRRRVYLADETKLVKRLGAFPLPVEIVAFGADYSAAALAEIATEPRPRLDERGAPFRTDSGNLIHDCRMPDTEDYAALDTALCAIPGVVATGLFVGLADELITIRDGSVMRVSGPEQAFW